VWELSVLKISLVTNDSMAPQRLFIFSLIG
jgi:hypothetical protein